MRLLSIAILFLLLGATTASAQAALAKKLKGHWAGTLDFVSVEDEDGNGEQDGLCAVSEADRSAIAFAVDVRTRKITPATPGAYALALTDQEQRKFTSTNVGESNKLNNFGNRVRNAPQRKDITDRFYGFTAIHRADGVLSATVTAQRRIYYKSAGAATSQCIYEYSGSVSKN